MYAMKSEKKKKILHKRYTHIYSVGKHQSKKTNVKKLNKYQIEKLDTIRVHLFVYNLCMNFERTMISVAWKYLNLITKTEKNKEQKYVSQ